MVPLRARPATSALHVGALIVLVAALGCTSTDPETDQRIDAVEPNEDLGSDPLADDESSMAAGAGEAGTGPQAYGDDADLDALYDTCEGGDDRACDLLYSSVARGSAYSDLAVDCAGRGDPESFCTDGIVTSADGFADPSSPGVTALVDDCKAGDMIACDTLFMIAELGSEAENIGNTCGGKIAVGAVPNCRTRFGS